jgi:hypothetical protein
METGLYRDRDGNKRVGSECRSTGMGRIKRKRAKTGRLQPSPVKE